MSEPPATAPKLAIWKFASCDGCQLTLLDCEDELLAVVGSVQVAHFLEASSATVAGPYDVSLVEGSITTAHDVDRIHDIREQSRLLVAIGACASAGGIQALRNYADVATYASTVYAHPEYLSTLATSSAVSEHVRVDFELRGCPISREQLLVLLASLVRGKVPRRDYASVCMECKRRGTACLMVARGEPCLGPVTQSGCNALCPAFDRGCFGCFGPADTANFDALVAQLRGLGLTDERIRQLFATFAVAAFAERLPEQVRP